MILFLRFRRATLLLTRGMDRSLRHQQPLEASFVGVRHERGLAQVTLPLRVLLGQDVALVGVVPAQPAGPRQLDALAERALGFLFRHLKTFRGSGFGARGSGLRVITRVPNPEPRVPHFGASTIDMLRPSSFGSCSILAMSFSSLATRSSTARPRSTWAICRPRY